MADGRHFENGFIAISQPGIIRLLKIVFGHISTIYSPINAKFNRKKHSHVQTFMWPEYQIW